MSTIRAEAEIELPGEIYVVPHVDDITASMPAAIVASGDRPLYVNGRRVGDQAVIDRTQSEVFRALDQPHPHIAERTIEVSRVRCVLEFRPRGEG